MRRDMLYALLGIFDCKTDGTRHGSAKSETSSRRRISWPILPSTKDGTHLYYC